MKQMKRLFAVLLAVVMLLGAVPVMNVGITASAADYNASAAKSYAETYVNDYNSNYSSYKGKGGDCANFVSQCLHAGGLQTDATWKPDSYAWVNVGGLYSYLTSKNYSVKYSASDAEVGDVVIYNNGSSAYGHATICVESGSKVASHTSDGIFNITYMSLTCVIKMNGSSYADLGEQFYAVILNTKYWKPISLNTSTNKITLETEKNVAYQKWRFTRQDDGAYRIESCANGKVLEMTNGERENRTQLTAHDDWWGGYYQQWYLIPRGDGYIFQSKHYSGEQWVMDLRGSSNTDGSVIQIYQRDDGFADDETWSIYAGNEVQLKATKLNVTVGTDAANTIFKWNNVYGATHFNLKIWKDKVDNSVSTYHSGWKVKSGYSVQLPSGKYEAYVDTCDNYQCLRSNIVTFTVTTHTHSYTSKVTQNATCTATGVRTYTCSCGASYTETIAALGHSYGAWTKLNDTQHQRVCSRDSSHVEKANHTWNSGTVTKVATCTAAGTKTYTCMTCSATKTETIAALGHSYGAWTKLNDTQHQRVCSRDSSHIEKANHTWNTGTVTKAATCTATGTKTYTCTACNATKTETIPVNSSNHVNTTNVAATASTCTAHGYTAGVYCNDCKKYISGHEAQPLAAHTLTTINQRAATCTAEGYTGDRYCTSCMQTIITGTTIGKTAHTLTTINHRDATYDADGYTGDQYCTTCNQTISTGTTIPKLVRPEPQPQPSGSCKWCGQNHGGAFGWLVKIIHNILAAILGARY